MNASEKILLSFIFRLTLLVAAVFAAHHLPDRSERTAATTEVAMAGEPPSAECDTTQQKSGEGAPGDDRLADMYLRD